MPFGAVDGGDGLPPQPAIERALGTLNEQIDKTSALLERLEEKLRWVSLPGIEAATFDGPVEKQIELRSSMRESLEYATDRVRGIQQRIGTMTDLVEL